MTKRVLVTGGAGYIGSHTVLQLVDAGYDVTVLDNLCNSSQISLDRVEELATRKNAITFFEVDLLDKAATEEVISKQATFDACIHFAGLKAVGESVAIPLKYYHGNITSSIYLIELLSKYGCKKIVFSSSATVYGMAEPPISEQTPAGVGLTNPYGRTKYFLEEIFRDVYKSDNEWGIVLLRYFNPAGAHPSGRIGEDPNGIPNNLMPYVQQVAVGRREFLTVFGDDYPTPDGTGVRDFIHVDDLAAGHLAAIGRLEAEETKSGCYTYNLGTGKGYSVLEMVKAMEVAAAKEIPYKVGPRREGDIASVYATPDKAKEELGWEAKKGLQEMCADAWRWQSENPTGYPKPDEGKA